MIRRLNELGVEDILVADSPGGLYNVGALTGIYQTSGMMDAVEGVSANLNYDVTNGSRQVEKYRRVSSFPLITPVLKSGYDYFGCKTQDPWNDDVIRWREKPVRMCSRVDETLEFHCRFPKESDFVKCWWICECVHPDITLVDAVV